MKTNPFETLTVCGKTYNLKLTGSEMAKLEAKLGSDLLTGMEKLTAVNTLAAYYYAAAKPFNDNITDIEDVYQLFDDYITDGGTYEQLQLKMMNIFVISGLLTQEAYNVMKNATDKQKETLMKLITESSETLSK